MRQNVLNLFGSFSTPYYVTRNELIMTAGIFYICHLNLFFRRLTIWQILISTFSFYNNICFFHQNTRLISILLSLYHLISSSALDNRWYYQRIYLSFCTPEESLKCKEVNFLFSMMLIVMTRKWLLSMNFANKNIVIITKWYANYHYSHTQLFKFLKYCVSPEKRFKYLILLSSCFSIHHKT